MTETKQVTPAPTSEELMREKRLQRNLKIVVGVLGALILLGLGAVAVRFVGLATGPKSAGSPAAGVTTAIATPAGEVVLELPQGAKVMSVSLSGNHLAVHHESPAGTGIAIIDLDTGRRITDVRTIAAVPKN